MGFALHTDCCKQSPLKHDWSIQLQMETRTAGKCWSLTHRYCFICFICRYLLIEMKTPQMQHTRSNKSNKNEEYNSACLQFCM